MGVMSNLQAIPRPVLVFVRGLPGSGKSYFAKALQAKIGADEVVMLDPDAIDYDSQEYLDLTKSLTEDGVDKKFHPYRLLRGRAHAGITNGKVIIWNQPFTNLDGFNKTVINLQNYAEEHDVKLPMLVVEVMVDTKVAKSRVDERKQSGGHGPSDNTFDRFNREYASFASEGFKTVTIQGQDDVDTSVETVLQALKSL